LDPQEGNFEAANLGLVLLDQGCTISHRFLAQAVDLVLHSEHHVNTGKVDA
jgi:hypothetical protein